MDAAIVLASLFNDLIGTSFGGLDHVKTLSINYLGRLMTAALARRIGVRRYVLSCSLYGFRDDIAARLP